MNQTQLKVTYSKLHETITLCKPRNVLQFASKYLQNSKQSAQYVEELQSYLTLPFMLYNADEFNNAASIIYSSYLSGKSILLSHLCTTTSSNPIIALYGTYAQGGSVNNILSCVDQSPFVLRDTLDGQAMMEIIQNFDLAGYGYSCNAIDEMLNEKLENLKQITFSLFLIILRFYFHVYEAYTYYKQEVYVLYAINQPSYVTELPLSGDMAVDQYKLKTYLQKKPRDLPPNAIPYTHAYHHQPLGGTGDGEYIQGVLLKVMASVLDEDKGQVSLDILLDKLVKGYIAATSVAI